MSKEQTAVDWLEKQLKKVLIDNQIQQTEYLFKQAKELEKKQRKNDYEAGGNYARCCSTLPKDIKESFEQYYNDKYNQSN